MSAHYARWHCRALIFLLSPATLIKQQPETNLMRAAQQAPLKILTIRSLHAHHR